METNRDSGVGRGGKSIDHQHPLIQYALLIEGGGFVCVLWIQNYNQPDTNSTDEQTFNSSCFNSLTVRAGLGVFSSCCAFFL